MTLRIGGAARGALCAEQRLTYERHVDDVGEAVGSRLEVDLIGGVVVRIDGVEVALRPGLDRLIVARLAMAAGSRVSAVRLVDDLWSDPPAGAGATLRVYLSRLRQGPLGDVLVGGRGGYALTVDPDSVDVIRLRRLLSSTDADSEPPVALAPLLESWGDATLAELDESPFFRAVADELDALRGAATVAVATRLIEHGDAHRAAALLRALPDSAREDDATLMLTTSALARAGRRDEALRLLDTRSGSTDDDVLNAHRESLIRGDGIRRGGGPVRNGIPRPLTPLVGRQAELAGIEQARLRSPLVTVAGPGGVGKTRLAVESVWRTAAPIDTEQWFVDLTTVDDSRSVLEVMATTVGATQPTTDAVVARLARATALLLIDNAEHVLDELRPLARHLAEQVDGLAMLVTSREPLAIPGEIVVRLGGLDTVDGGEAVQLLADRVGHARGGAGLTTAELQSAAELCRALDGLPLALELAAARADVASLESIAASALIDDTAPDGDPHRRHASLTQLIGWSVARLGPLEASVLRELAWFAGPFRLPAATAILTPGDPDARARAVLDLARKSLLATEEGYAGALCYRVLESTRAVVASDAASERDHAWRLRHLRYFTQLVAGMESNVRGPSAPALHAAFDTQAPDLDLALRTAIAERDRTAALTLAGGQAWHWFKRGLIAHGRAQIERALAVPGDAAGGVEADAYVALTNLAYQSGDAEAAFGYVEAGIVVAQATGNDAALARLLAYAAYGRSLFGDPAVAQQLMEQALALSEGAPDWLRSEILMSSGQVLRALRKPASALERLDRARRLAESSGHAWARTSSEYVTGKVLIEAKRPRDAIGVLAHGARSAHDDDDPTGALALAHAAGGAAAMVERHAIGARIFGAVDANGRRYGYNPLDVEGDEAARFRELVAAGLSAVDYDRELHAGASLDTDELLRLVDELHRSVRGR